MKHQELPSFAISQLSKLFALIIKVDWLEQDSASLVKPFQKSIIQLLSLAKVFFLI